MSSPSDPQPKDDEKALRLEAERICEGLVRAYAEASERGKDKDAEITRLRAALKDLQLRIVRAMH